MNKNKNDCRWEHRLKEEGGGGGERGGGEEEEEGGGGGGEKEEDEEEEEKKSERVRNLKHEIYLNTRITKYCHKLWAFKSHIIQHNSSTQLFAMGSRLWGGRHRLSTACAPTNAAILNAYWLCQEAVLLKDSQAQASLGRRSRS